MSVFIGQSLSDQLHINYSFLRVLLQEARNN